MTTDEIERILGLIKQIPDAKWSFGEWKHLIGFWPNSFSAKSPSGQEVELREEFVGREVGSFYRFSVWVNGSKITEDDGLIITDAWPTIEIRCTGPASRLYKELKTRLKPRMDAAEREAKRKNEKEERSQLGTITDKW